MKEIYFSYTLYIYFSTQSPLTATYFFSHSVHLFSPFMKKVSGWLLIHLSMAASTLASDEKCWPFKVSFNYGNNQKSDGAKSGLQRACGTTVNFRLVMASWDCALKCDLALPWFKRNLFLSSWFCGCVAWVIVMLHNTCRYSPSIL